MWVLRLAANDLASFEARSAHVLTLRGLTHERAYTLNVWIPAALSATV